MSIFIKGMEMPTSCYKCYLKQRNGMDIVCPVLGERFSIADVNILYYRLDNCPIDYVPHHGRLIDADAVERNLLKMQQAQTGPCSHGVRKSRAVLRDAPTIIPASEEGET